MGVLPPQGAIKFAIDRNATTGGFYLQTVKIMKRWRDRLPTALSRPKSYVLETLVAKTQGTASPASHAAAVVKVLEGIWDGYSGWVGSGTVPSISDPGYSSVNVAKRWEPAEFDAFLSQVEDAAGIARQAWEEADEARSVVAWRKLFGKGFAPSP